MELHSIFEGDSAAKQDFTLMYNHTHSVAAKRGTPVLQSDVSKSFFYIKTNKSDASAWLTLTDASSSQIEWTGPTTGAIRVKYGADTAGRASSSPQYWELRIKFTDGTYLTWAEGTISVKESIVDQAS
jgi:hypothetical protein